MSYAALVHSAVIASAVPQLLQGRPAVILERIACGGGATYWYYCANYEQLEDVTSRFTPGSDVRFYFDGRIARGFQSDELLPHLDALLDRAIHVPGIGIREIVFGVLSADGVLIDVGFPSSRGEIEEQLEGVDAATPVFFGYFPAHDNDGKNAVSLYLPDADGVRRPHPY